MKAPPEMPGFFLGRDLINDLPVTTGWTIAMAESWPVVINMQQMNCYALWAVGDYFMHCRVYCIILHKEKLVISL